MADFDFEPEDAYDASDPPLTIVLNLLRRMELLDGLPAPRTRDVGALIAIIEHRVEEPNLRHVDERGRLRLEQIIGDLATLRARLA